MALPITLVTDFKGDFQLPTNKLNQADLVYDINDLEESFIQDLLGSELAGLLIADLNSNNVPQTARFQTIYNKLRIENESFCIYKSEGIKFMLKAFIYFNHGRRYTRRLTMVGEKQVDSENSVNVSSTQLIRGYNRGIETYQAIQHYILLNQDVYPEFKGLYKAKAGLI